MTASISPSDRCDSLIVNVRAAPELNERQRRFLDAYRQRVAIAPAARLARVHRATVYRWMANAAFVAAMRAAADAFFRDHKAKILAQEEAREQWRRQREAERRPMRCYYLARAREAKRLGHAQ
jgi:mevalonate pyrophosphate decarboxylase